MDLYIYDHRQIFMIYMYRF